jgi:murein DD-endopeptidase MepM/ murein hydrolase activator NlpD
MALVILLVALSAFSPWAAHSALAQGGALDSTITLQMPFIAGETWIVGGPGYFYGEVTHTNANNDYYATDWNLPGPANADLGKPVLPVANGFVSVVDTVCAGNYGCYVQIDHADGYRTVYAHLSQMLVATGSSVYTWTLIGKVGKTGNASGPHLHLRFQRNNGGYYSKCWNNGQTCPNGEAPQQPQGHRPSPMMTTSGFTTLVDGQPYTSVNGRVHLPDLRNNNGWYTGFYVRNDGTEFRNVNIYYFNPDGTPTPQGSDVCGLDPNQWCWIPVNESNRIPTSGSVYIDSGEAVSVVVIRQRSNGYVTAAYTGMINAPIANIPVLYTPMIHRNNSGWYSDVIVTNASTISTDAAVSFQRQNQSGDVCTELLSDIPAYGTVTLSTSGLTCLTTPFNGSARVTGSQPIIAIATQWKDYTGDGIGDALADYEGMPASNTTNHFAFLMRGNGGWDSGLSLQNPGSANTVTINYYNTSGGGCGQTNTTILQNSVTGYYPLPVTCSLPYYGSGKAAGSQALASIVNHIYPLDRDVTSNGALGGNTKTVVIPLAFKNLSMFLGHSGLWNTGLVIRNTGSGTATATIDFYDSGGAEIYTTSRTISVSGASILSPLPGVLDGFIGSVRVSANQNIAVSATHNVSGTSGDDSAMAYIGINR